MPSVTKRIAEIKQPYGGYVKVKSLQQTQLSDGIDLFQKENVSAAIVGTVVDYMSRLMTGDKVAQAFSVSMSGYKNRIQMLSYQYGSPSKVLEADIKHKVDIMSLLAKVRGLDDESIISACQVVTYDVWMRNMMDAMACINTPMPIPDASTISNIRTMIHRSYAFFNEYGPVTSSGFVFAEHDENGNVVKSGYTETVNSGDGDYLTKDTLWDFKVSKSEPTSKQTLQILMYWLMGQHSQMSIFKNITHIGLFNPRLNKVYRLAIESIPIEIIKEVETNVIGY